MIISDKERQAPLSLDEAEPSHIARYIFAQKFIAEKDTVLDVPCGTGYGSFAVAQKNTLVYGVDISEPAITHAREFFQADNAHFVVTDMQHMINAFPEDMSFDKIVSFEGIEHVANPELFLNEVVRLLKKDGIFVVSTPRRPHGSPYHFTEYSLEEFRALLSLHFKVERMFGQIFTDIFDISERSVNPDEYKRFNFIAICRPL